MSALKNPLNSVLKRVAPSGISSRAFRLLLSPCRLFPFWLPCLLPWVFPGFSQAEPLLFMGRANAEFSGAVSHDFTKSPLDYPEKQGQARFMSNLPLDFSARAHEYLQDINDSTVVMPVFLASVFQRMNAQIEVSAPLGPTTIFFAARENAALNVTGGLGDTRFNLDTTLEESGSLLLKGGIHLPLLLDMRWRSLSFGFTFSPSSYTRVGFQLHKHLVAARLAGNLKPDLLGRLDISVDGANTSAVIEYPDDRIYGLARGNYRGEAWSPEVAVRVGPLSLVSRMGAHIQARGDFLIDYSVPFFIDAETFEPTVSEPDSFLSPDNIRRFLDSEVNRKSIAIKEDLWLNLPQSHTLKLTLWKERIGMSYTRTIGDLYARHNPTVEWTDDDERLNAAMSPDHITVMSLRWGGFSLDAGAHTLNVDYNGRKNLLTGLFPLEFGGDPWVPIVNLGVSWGLRPRVHMQINVMPLPAVRMGVSHAI